jgi:hypothetical protein
VTVVSHSFITLLGMRLSWWNHNHKIWLLRNIFLPQAFARSKFFECVFGMLSSKCIFEVPVCCNERAASSVIRAAYVLHRLLCIGKGHFPTQKISYERIISRTEGYPGPHQQYNLTSFHSAILSTWLCLLGKWSRKQNSCNLKPVVEL